MLNFTKNNNDFIFINHKLNWFSSPLLGYRRDEVEGRQGRKASSNGDAAEPHHWCH